MIGIQRSALDTSLNRQILMPMSSPGTDNGIFPFYGMRCRLRIQDTRGQVLHFHGCRDSWKCKTDDMFGIHHFFKLMIMMIKTVQRIGLGTPADAGLHTVQTSAHTFYQPIQECLFSLSFFSIPYPPKDIPKTCNPKTICAVYRIFPDYPITDRFDKIYCYAAGSQ